MKCHSYEGNDLDYNAITVYCSFGVGYSSWQLYNFTATITMNSEATLCLMT
jgi:hypothetical protein